MEQHCSPSEQFSLSQTHFTQFSSEVSERKRGMVDASEAPCHCSAPVPGSHSSLVFGSLHNSLVSLATLSQVSQAGN